MKLRGVYTVEAAIMISFCIIIFGAAVGVSYKVFENAICYVDTAEDEFNAVKMFRSLELASTLVDRILGE